MFFKRAKDMENSIKLHEVRIAELEAHKKWCDQQHSETVEHNKRSDDIVKGLVSSNFAIAESLNQLNITFVKEVIPKLDKAESGFSTVDTMKGWFITGKNIKMAFLYFAAIGSGLGALALLNKFLMGG